ncbi:MAG: cbb3-type cytochrome c oxidase subunit I [Pirellulaceae bacterium]|nr:cbb3-type cytochrome c oxidase subunit I [Pirellulaceae bacterium]
MTTSLQNLNLTCQNQKVPWLFNHRVIGKAFLFLSLFWMVGGGLLALAVRWQLAWPWEEVPVLGSTLFTSTGGKMPQEFYTMLFTMHATVMLFLVVIPLLTGAFGNLLIPPMIGTDRMYSPKLCFWHFALMWPGYLAFTLSFFSPGYGPSSGWTAYAPLATFAGAAPGSGQAQTLWLIGIVFVSLSSLAGSINTIATIFQRRTKELTMFRLPMTIWCLLIAAIIQLFGLPVLLAGGTMQILDRSVGTTFFQPQSLVIAQEVFSNGGGDPLAWQHLFWFYSHPAVYVMILPVMGMISEILSCFARKPLFGYRGMIISVCSIAIMGFLVWGHHMFVSGMNQALGATFALSTMLIAIPSALKTFNWLGTLWRANIQFTTAMLFSISFVFMFLIGGLSGIFMASPAVDTYIHDSYFIVAHIHYVLFGSSIMGVFGAFHYWFPSFFGKTLNETLGKIHFVMTFLFLNGTFFLMHLLGIAGMPRRTADPYHLELFRPLLPMNQWITLFAILLTTAQLIFVINFFYTLFFGKKSPPNPWRANTLEWQNLSDCGTVGRTVFHAPYRFNHSNDKLDYCPQNQESN